MRFANSFVDDVFFVEFGKQLNELFINENKLILINLLEFIQKNTTLTISPSLDLNIENLALKTLIANLYSQGVIKVENELKSKKHIEIGLGFANKPPLKNIPNFSLHKEEKWLSEKIPINKGKYFSWNDLINRIKPFNTIIIQDNYFFYSGFKKALDFIEFMTSKSNNPEILIYCNYTEKIKDEIVKFHNTFKEKYPLSKVFISCADTTEYFHDRAIIANSFTIDGGNSFTGYIDKSIAKIYTSITFTSILDQNFYNSFSSPLKQIQEKVTKFKTLKRRAKYWLNLGDIELEKTNNLISNSE